MMTEGMKVVVTVTVISAGNDVWPLSGVCGGVGSDLAKDDKTLVRLR